MSNIKSTKSATTRTRNFASILYPDSAPENWLDILSDFHVPCFVSPLHDKDVNPDGEIKKPHYHIFLTFENVKTPEQAQEIFDSIGCVGREIVQSLRGYARYLCHLDNPEKYQYQPDDVLCLCGTDYNDVIGLPTDKYKAIREMQHWCLDNKVLSFATLLEYASENRSDWFRVLCDSGAYVIEKYLKSKTWTLDYYKPSRDSSEESDD